MKKSIQRIIIAMVLGFVWGLIGNSAAALELKTQYQGSYPKYFKSASDAQKIEGLCIDVLRAVEKEVPGLKITAPSEFMPFKRLQYNLDQGTIDLFFGFAKNAKRAKQYVFIDIPLYEVNHVIAVNSDDMVQVNSFDDIRKMGTDNTILTNFGTSTERFLKKQGGLTVDAAGKDLFVNLKKLAHGRGRFVYFHDIGLISTIKKAYSNNEFKVLPISFKKYHHYAAFSKKVPKSTIKKIETALKTLSQNGTLARIQKKYSNF